MTHSIRNNKTQLTLASALTVKMLKEIQCRKLKRNKTKQKVETVTAFRSNCNCKKPKKNRGEKGKTARKTQTGSKQGAHPQEGPCCGWEGHRHLPDLNFRNRCHGPRYGRPQPSCLDVSSAGQGNSVRKRPGRYQILLYAKERDTEHRRFVCIWEVLEHINLIYSWPRGYFNLIIKYPLHWAFV